VKRDTNVGNHADQVIDEDDDEGKTHRRRSPAKGALTEKASELAALKPEERASELASMPIAEILGVLAAMPSPEDALAALDCMDKKARASTLAAVSKEALGGVHLPDSDFRDLMQAKLQAAMDCVKQLKWAQATKLLQNRAEVLNYYRASCKQQMEELIGERKYGPAEARRVSLELCKRMRSFVVKPQTALAGERVKTSGKTSGTTAAGGIPLRESRATETAKLKLFGASLASTTGSAGSSTVGGPKGEAAELAAHLRSLKALIGSSKKAVAEEDDGYC